MAQELILEPCGFMPKTAVQDNHLAQIISLVIAEERHWEDRFDAMVGSGGTRGRARSDNLSPTTLIFSPA
jgi:hypothetical protein